MKLSARNQLTGKVAEIEAGPVTSLVKVDVGGQMITASITSDAVADLGIAVGADVTVVFKASSVMVAV